MELRSKINDVQHYMKTRNVSQNLKMRIRRYMEYMHEEEKMGSQRGELHLNCLSDNLKLELFQEAYGKTNKFNSFF